MLIQRGWIGSSLYSDLDIGNQGAWECWVHVLLCRLEGRVSLKSLVHHSCPQLTMGLHGVNVLKTAVLKPPSEAPAASYLSK